MAKDRDEELKRLEEELLTDIPIEVLPTEVAAASEAEITDDDLADYQETPQAVFTVPQADPAQKREDKWQIALMITASVLSLGIIGVLVYWLEVFLR